MQQGYNTDNWDAFYLQFKNTQLGERLGSKVPQKLLRQFLSPVLTLKNAIERWELVDGAQKRLTIRIHGAELPEITDHGRWYGLLPTLLGQSFEVTVVYNQAKAKPLPSPNPEAIDLLPEVEFLESSEARADVTVVSHPDFITRQRQKDIELMTSGGPLVALYWSAIDVAMEGAWFEHHGYEETERMHNPFTLENNVDNVASWGRFVTCLKPGNPDPSVSWEELRDLGWLRHHSGLSGFGHPAGAPGKLRKDFQLRSQDSTMGFHYVLDDLYLSSENNWLYRFDSDTRQLEPVYEVDAELVRQAPESGKDILKAYQWAAQIKMAFALTPMESDSVAQDYFVWLQDAARRGNPCASMAYARWLEAGYAGEPNPDHAFYEYRRAADAGMASAAYVVAEMAFHDLKDPDFATQYFTKAADKGYALAQFNLGLIHLDGLIGAAEPAKGLEYLLAAAKSGEVNSLCYLGEWLMNQGKLGEAMGYWIKAADMGSVEAAGQVLNHAEAWRQRLPEKEQRKFKKQVRNYSKMLKANHLSH